MASALFHPALAWSIAPGFFWAGLALAGIPVIIHFLNRRRFRMVPWAAMEYLLAALRKNRRRIRFEQFLLLATRCALLVLLGLSLARPLSCGHSSLASLAAGRTGLHVFVIDNSYSMAYEADRPQAKTHLDQAKSLAKRQIDRLAPGGQSVTILSAARYEFGSPGNSSGGSPQPASDSAIVLRASYDLDAAKTAVDQLEQSYCGTDLVGALQLAVRLARQDTHQPQKYLYLLTDFTCSAWEGPDAGMLRQLGSELSAVFGQRIRIHDLGRPGQWNYAVRDLRPDGRLVTTRFHADFLADVRGFGSGPEAVLQWRWNGQLLGDSLQVKPGPGLSLQRQTRVEPSQGGPQLLDVTIVSDDKLPADNVRRRVVQVASEMKVLIVEGRRGAQMLSGSGAFLDLALAPRREVGPGGVVRNDSYVAPDLVSDLELDGRLLTDYRALILADVPSLSPLQADRLASYVQQGGTLMLFLGEQVNIDIYNGVLLPRGLLPGRIIARRSVPADARPYTLDFNPHGLVHPLLDVFRGQEKSGLDTAQVYAYFQVELDPARRAESILSYQAEQQQTGDSAITVHSLGAGRIILCTTTASPDWTTLPAKPAYPALIHELLAGTVNVGDDWMNLLVGQPLLLPPTMRLTAPPVLTDSSGRQIPLEATTSEGRTFYRSQPIRTPGIYRLQAGAQSFPVVVNLPPDEADIRLLPPEAIRRALGGIDAQILGDELPGEAVTQDQASEFGWALMIVVLALAGAECFMAMRFGHYRRK